MARPGFTVSPEAIKQMNIATVEADAKLRFMLGVVNSLSPTERRRLLRELNTVVDDLDRFFVAYMQQWTPWHYVRGSNNAIEQMQKLGMTIRILDITTSDQQAMSLIANNGLDLLRGGLTVLQRTFGNIITESTRTVLEQEIAKKAGLGADLLTTKQVVSATLQDNGIFVLRDRAGKRWDLPTYSDMLARTEMANSSREGRANRYVQNGNDLVQIDGYGSSHPECAKWEFVVVSLTGQTQGFPTLDEAVSEGLMHPNCLTNGNKILTSKGATVVEEIRDGATVCDRFGKSTKVVKNVISDYSGVIYTVGSGNFKMSGTPNHACLTEYGWLRFDHIREGDNIVNNKFDVFGTGIDGLIFNSDNRKSITHQKTIADIISNSLISVASSVNFNNISSYRMLEDKINSFHPLNDERFVLVGISFESLRKIISTFFPNIIPIRVSTVFDKMLLGATARNTELIHRIFNAGSTSITKQLSDLLGTHLFFMIDTTQKDSDWLTSFLLHFFGDGFHVVDALSSNVQTLLVYDIETESGSYIIDNNKQVISHNCKHNFNVYNSDLSSL